VLAVALERVYRATGDEDFLARCLPPTIAFYRWLAATRDPDRDELIAIIQPDECGVDASPKFDPLMRYPQDNRELVAWIDWLYQQYAPLRFDDPAILALDLFQVEEIITNVFYILGLESLARLTAGDPTQSAEFRDWAARVQTALVAKCWDDELGGFFDLAGQEERPLRTMTITALVPIALPTLDRAIVARLEGYLRVPAPLAAGLPLGSVSMRYTTYLPLIARGFIWRGPSWINSNWLINEGLRAHGIADLRATLTDATCAMVERSGFREYYHPNTAEGFGSRDHSWSTIVVDMLDGPVARGG
jgi:glycogen debranching enzyme